MLGTVAEKVRKIPLLLWAFVACLIVLPLFSGLDLFISGLFYDDQTQRFFWADAQPFHQLYAFLAFIDAPLLLLLLGLMGWSFYRHWRSYSKRLIAFLLISLIVGPGLITNTILKDNSIGRPRPVHIVDFGGDKTFTPAMVYSGQCERNCSFVSGHAALGFYCMVLGWILQRRKAFWLGFGLGCLASFGRIVQGGHFFSDTVFAFWVVLFTLIAMSYVFRLPMPINPWLSWDDLATKDKTE